MANPVYWIDIPPTLRLASAVPTVQIKNLTFHPSIWPKMIGEVSRDAKPGALVQVIGKEGTPFGWGLWNPRSRMPLRLVSHSTEPLDESFFEAAIRRAAALRRDLHQLDATTNSYRAIHGDADFLPGMVADKFADVLSVEITALAAWQRLPGWLPLLHECFETRRLIVSVDPELARIENIPSSGGAESDKLRSVKILEHGIRYEIDFSQGHKTGFFCDQRDNRRKFGTFAKDRTVLDLCCNTGGFAISPGPAGTADVTAIDLDENAVAMAKRNANINSAKVKFTHADAFTWLRTMIENGRTWDLVIADPPKFIHGREDELGIAKYADLNKLALKMVTPGGLYVTCSCSGQLGADAFERIVIVSAHRNNLRLQTFDRTGAGPDHPTLSNYPESRYLKTLWSRVL
ncbi:MAG: class I SAM-dependent rRNA methyltransferase [Akkermansiaceae bacterium]|nr:class I SAM-dependent rRNA methyltransferase [Akkermansiaceae bacterium]